MPVQAAESTRQRLARKLLERKTQELQSHALLTANALKGGAHSPLILHRLRCRFAALSPSMSPWLDDSTP